MGKINRIKDLYYVDIEFDYNNDGTLKVTLVAICKKTGKNVFANALYCKNDLYHLMNNYANINGKECISTNEFKWLFTEQIKNKIIDYE